MSPRTFSNIPEEIRQEVISYLDYNDAWSLKQTSTLFYRVVEIPTIKSFLACPYGPSLGMLEEWQVIPLGHEVCHYCNRLLPKERFSRFQRHLTRARQYTLVFDYTTWKLDKHYCFDCGVMNHHYPTGKKIYIGFGDPGFKEEAVAPCEHCGILIDCFPWDFRFCPNCNELLGADELIRPWIYDPCSSSSDSYSGMTDADVENRSEEVVEPESKDYEGAEPESLLALIGERLLLWDCGKTSISLSEKMGKWEKAKETGCIIGMTTLRQKRLMACISPALSFDCICCQTGTLAVTMSAWSQGIIFTLSLARRNGSFNSVKHGECSWSEFQSVTSHQTIASLVFARGVIAFWNILTLD